MCTPPPTASEPAKPGAHRLEAGLPKAAGTEPAMPEADPPEVEELENVAAWRLRLFDANPTDTASAAAARHLEALTEDLRRGDHAAPWTELRAICNWLAESDAISDYTELAGEYRARIGVSTHPGDAADYLSGLLAIARSLV